MAVQDNVTISQLLRALGRVNIQLPTCTVHGARTAPLFRCWRKRFDSNTMCGTASLYGKCGDKPRVGIAGNRTSFLFHNNSNASMHAIAIVIVILLHTIVFIKPLLCSINRYLCASSICLSSQLLSKTATLFRVGITMGVLYTVIIILC